MTAFEWAPLYTASLYLGLGVGLVLLVLLARRLARSPAARRGPLLLLRLAELVLLLVLLLNPVRVTEARLPSRPPEVVYLVDCSRSMALDRPTSRLNQVKRALRDARRYIPAESPLKISLYRFGDQLAAATSADEFQATEEATRLLAALERLPARFEDGRPGGLVVFSDGRATETSGFDEIAAGYRRLGVPIHVFPVGDPGIIGDVAIQEVIAPRDAPTGSRVPIRVHLRSRGYADRRTEVRIRAQGDPSRSPLATLPITLSDGTQTHELLITHGGGDGRLVVEVPPFEGEAIRENNQVPFQIGARKPKIRVIYMEGSTTNYQTGTPGEYRYIRDALIEDPNMECVAMEVDEQYANRPRLFRVHDPSRGYPTTREELFSYDVIICSDISRGAFTDEQLAWTAELVAQRGGGFVMIGGHTSFGSGGWGQTVWDGLIPVDMSRDVVGADGKPYTNQGFGVRVPPEAERHPIWRIVDDPVQNREILARMPAFSGTNLIQRLKPGATLLGLSDRPINPVGIMPVFACESYGKGRTFAMATDSTYSWGTLFETTWGEGDNRYFRKFWRNAIQWLAENSAGGNRRLRVETDKLIYRPGQPIKVSARAYDDKLEETTRYRIVARLRPGTPAAPNVEPPAPIQEATLVARADDRQYETELACPPLRLVPVAADSPLAPFRRATLDVAAYDGTKVAAQTTVDVQVLDDPIEFENPQPDAARLEEIAQASGGRVLHTAEDLAQVLGRLTMVPGEVVVHKAPLWDNPLLWAVLVGLLAVEWSLRRWWGLA
jgi:uncharacterized membrane protein